MRYRFKSAYCKYWNAIPGFWYKPVKEVSNSGLSVWLNVHSKIKCVPRNILISEEETEMGSDCAECNTTCFISKREYKVTLEYPYFDVVVKVTAEDMPNAVIEAQKKIRGTISMTSVNKVQVERA